MSIITKVCTNKSCDGSEFIIEKGCGYIDYYCTTCKNKEGRERIGEYKTISNRCENCGGNIIKIKMDNDKGEKRFLCKECEKALEVLYINEELKELTEEDYNQAIEDSIIEELDEKVIELERKTESIEDSIYELKEGELWELRCKLKRIDEENKDLRYKIEELERENNHLEREMRELKEEIKEELEYLNSLRDRI